MTKELPDEVEVTEAPMESGESFLHSVTSQTPWWIVSILLHTLLIAFAGLVSMAIVFDDDEKFVITESVFEQRKEMRFDEPKQTIDGRDKVLCNYGKETDETQDKVVVIPEMLPNAIPGLDFSTINENFKELGANGEEYAKVFYHEQGVTGAAGGGGSNGFALADSLIGVDGVGSIGRGHGFGGGDGDGIGPGTGPGKASYGGRFKGNKFSTYRPYGATKGSIGAVEHALTWLAYHQEPDGRWDAMKYGSGQKTDTAVTAFALLAFLGNGHTEKFGEHRKIVERAVGWLKSKQDEKGMIWDKTDAGAHRGEGYPCAIATLALCDAAGMGNVKETRVAAQKAIDYCINIHQFGDGSYKLGWRYAAKSEGDLSVTGWFIMAMKSARVAGLKVDQAAFDGAIRFLDKCEIKEAGADPAYAVSKYKYMANNEHAHTAHRLTAIGTLARQFLGWRGDETRGSVEWFMSKGGVPSFGANGESVDLYYWYYGSMSVFQCDDELFKRWSTGLINALVPNQCKTGDDFGSWNPTGDYSADWGRVGQTAISALCLEVFWRWPRTRDQH